MNRELEKEDKFIVINKKRFEEMGGALPIVIDLLKTISEFERVYEVMTKKKVDQKYIVCNQDEPYAEAVWDLILNRIVFSDLKAGETDVRGLESKILKNAYSGVLLVSDDGEEFGICNRDSGFEFQYADIWYEAKEGTLKRMGEKTEIEKLKLKLKEIIEYSEEDEFKGHLSDLIENWESE